MNTKTVVCSVSTAIFLLLLSGCRPDLLKDHQLFTRHVMEDTAYFYFCPYQDQAPSGSMAIGLFDSGIGGLSVFEAMAKADHFDGDGNEIPDGVPDFLNEQVVFLADHANMPYSHYAEIGREELLVDHILKDAMFLVNPAFYPDPRSAVFMNGKPPVKHIVIACNTATAYGIERIQALFGRLNIGVQVTGIIQAGAKGAIEILNDVETGTIAVLATPGTVASGAYPEAISEELKVHFPGRDIKVLQHGGKGWHEAIEARPGFLNDSTCKVYSDYRGPSLIDPEWAISKELLPVYRFDTCENHLLYNAADLQASDSIQLNSMENYVRFHLVSLLEKARTTSPGIPLRAVILGCTHYPYSLPEISKVLEELKGESRYREILGSGTALVDPAGVLAREVYRFLRQKELLNSPDSNRIEHSLFFTSIPNIFNPEVKTDGNGHFTYDYQYLGRSTDQVSESTLLVPFSEHSLSADQLRQLKTVFLNSYGILTREAEAPAR